MSVNITIRSGEDRPFAAEIHSLPAKIEIDREKGSPAVFIFVAVLLFILYQFIASVLPSVALPVLLVAVAGLAIAFGLWLRNRERPHVVQFDRGGVDVHEQGILFGRNWRAPYSEFEGVVMRRKVARAQKGKASYQIIELKHPDEHKTLPLFVDKSKTAPTKEWRAYAELFGVKAKRGEGN